MASIDGQSTQANVASYESAAERRVLAGGLAGFGSVGTTAPVISTLSPLPGTITRTTPVNFEVTDDLDELGIVRVDVDYGAAGVRVLYDGAIQNGFELGSNASGVANGLAFSVVPDKGWDASFVLKVVAIDEDGNRVDLIDASYTVSNPGDAVTAVIDNADPPIPAVIAPADPVGLDITHELDELVFVELYVVYADDSRDAIYDTPNGFRPPFGGSSVSSITNGFRFDLERDGGWRGAPLQIGVSWADRRGHTDREPLEWTVDPVPGPIVENFDPVDTSTIAAADPISLDALSLPGLATITLFVNDGTRSELAYNNGFVAPYAASSNETNIAGGTRYTLERTGGWPTAAITVHARAVDLDEHEATASASYTISDPPPGADVTAPAITNITPAPGTPITRQDPVFVDVTDAGGLGRTILAAQFADGPYEVVHDGTAFAAGYAALSSRTPISDGFTYRVRRTAGWPSGPTLKVWAVDSAGNEET